VRPRRLQRARGGGVARRIISRTKASVSPWAGVVIGGGGAASAKAWSTKPWVSFNVHGSEAACAAIWSPTRRTSAIEVRQAVNGRTSLGDAGMDAKLGRAVGFAASLIAPLTTVGVGWAVGAALA
jgi:hypothetical protein